MEQPSRKTEETGTHKRCGGNSGEHKCCNSSKHCTTTQKQLGAKLDNERTADNHQRRVAVKVACQHCCLLSFIKRKCTVFRHCNYGKEHAQPDLKQITDSITKSPWRQ